MVTRQQAWGTKSAFLITSGYKLGEYFKGKSNGADPDRWPGMIDSYKKEIPKEKKAYEEARDELGKSLTP